MRKSSKSRRTGRPSSRTTLRDDGIVLLQRKRGNETRRLSAKTGWTFDWEELDDLVAYPDASWLVAHVTEALLRHHVEAIKAGKDPATGGAVPKLDPKGVAGTDARQGKRPDIRGIARTDGRDLASLLTRSKVSASSNIKIGKGRLGGSARATIGGGSAGHAAYLRKAQADHRVEHLAIDGDAEKVIDQAIAEWIDMMLQGAPDELPEFGPVQGRDL